ncbi:MAG: alpha-amylase family glycosyl hydrolase [Chthoniobacteraceae bacterium]
MERPRIYQLLPRLFGNTNETRQPNGTLAENGTGKFADISDTALCALRDELHVTHVWLTGIHAQATATDWSEIGKPADDPDLLKGLAGSPYAIKDYADVCPDYAVDPARRIEEFQSLLARAHALGLRVIIDFVANHVARSHRSALVDFGANDDRSKFFSPQNSYFWLQPDSPGGGPPLRLPTVVNGERVSPTCRVLGAGDGFFSGEMTSGRVTGNNAATWAPSLGDWYETVKLNYGYDFTTGTRAFPIAANPSAPLPDTWLKMDAVLAHWQSLGIDGFRCDMAHMVPPEFWAWAIARARARKPNACFFAEAYENDPMKVDSADPALRDSGVMSALLHAGFDATYDDPAYKTLKHIYDGPAWANDLDGTLAAQRPEFFINALRYGENHDEVRLAGRGHWGGIGMDVGRAVCGVLFGISRGPVLLYHGQETGEPADGAEGFGGDDARTSIFDYWSMPEFTKWVNGHRYDGGCLSAQQRGLREFCGRLLAACGAPAFRDGSFIPLNGANTWNSDFGRIEGEPASGHWLYAYLRVPAPGAPPFLIVVNLHRDAAQRNVRVQFSDDARRMLAALPDELLLEDRVGGLAALRITRRELFEHGCVIPELPPLTPAYFELLAPS